MTGLFLANAPHVEAGAPDLATRSIASFLATQPSGDGVCQWLVTQWLKPLDAFSAILMSVKRNGDLFMLGSFGIEEEVLGAFQSRKIWERWPITDTARERIPLFITSVEQLTEIYPQMTPYSEGDWSNMTLITEPLVAGDMVTGALAVSFRKKLTQTQRGAANLDLIATLLALWGSSLTRGVQGSSVGIRTVHSEVQQDSDPLTERQALILSLMAEDKTNAVIAYALGFSESTVRHESMRIYRKLGVSRRQEAIHVGRERGLIK